MTLTFCPPDTTQMCIYQSFLITRKFTIIPLKLCSCAWLDHELQCIYKYLILCFQVFYRNWCDRNYIALTGVFFFNIFAVLYDVYVWCFTVNGDLACFFLLILQLLGSHLPSFLFLNQFYKLIYKFCCVFFHVFCKTHLIILLQSEVPMEKYHMILRSHMTSP